MGAVGSSFTRYLAEIPNEYAGRKLRIDIFDPGDGDASSSATGLYLKVKGPAASVDGSLPPIPPGGTPLPAASIATSCSYNATGTQTKTPFTTGTPDADCSFKTQNAGVSGTGIYNGLWLHIEVQIDPAYTCGTPERADCWWTLEHQFGTYGFPTDRTVFTVSFAS